MNYEEIEKEFDKKVNLDLSDSFRDMLWSFFLEKLHAAEQKGREEIKELALKMSTSNSNCNNIQVVPLNLFLEAAKQPNPTYTQGGSSVEVTGGLDWKPN